MKRRDALKHTAILGGSSIFSASFLALLQSCMEASDADYTPRFLRPAHADLVAALVDTLLPRTDTPGGLDVKVDRYIDLVYDQCYGEAAQEGIVEALNAFDKKSVAKFGKSFAKLSGEKRTQMLQEEEKQSPKFNRGVWGMAVGEQEPVGFYRSFKAQAIGAYFTSKEIAENVTNYDPVPGPFKGCVPFDEVGKVWSY